MGIAHRDLKVIFINCLFLIYLKISQKIYFMVRQIKVQSSKFLISGWQRL